jgi:hypothetical protein
MTGSGRRARARSSASRYVLIAIACAATTLAIAATEPLRLGFGVPGPDGLPAGWTALTFKKIKRHTRYEVMRSDAGYVVKAEAEASASGLIRRIDVDTRQHRMLQWRWKVERLLDKSDVRSRQGDDYAARIYVAFAYDPTRASLGQRIRYEAVRLIYGEYPPHAGLNYVWDRTAPAGTSVPNAFTDRVRMIVVESGAARLGQWVAYERDIYADYRQAFGEDPPHISGVAIMTDTDGTGESAVAYYADMAILAPAQ